MYIVYEYTYFHITVHVKQHDKLYSTQVFLQMTDRQTDRQTDTTKVEKCCRGNKELLITKFTCMQLFIKKIIRFFMYSVLIYWILSLFNDASTNSQANTHTHHGPSRSDRQTFDVRLSSKQHLKLLFHPNHRTHPPSPLQFPSLAAVPVEALTGTQLN
jgi:hypothetical protein